MSMMPSIYTDLRFMAVRDAEVDRTRGLHEGVGAGPEVAGGARTLPRHHLEIPGAPSPEIDEAAAAGDHDKIRRCVLA